MSSAFSPPPSDCLQCPRLVEFREANKAAYPDYFNGAVPSFGSLDAEVLIVGLAPGLKGANATGRPFTGDYAGDVLYPSLVKAGLAKGEYGQSPDDGLELLNCRITNAVRCVPPENKPTTAEIKECNPFLRDEILAMPNLRLILSLGGISHKAVLQCLGYKQSAFKFGHAAEHEISLGHSKVAQPDAERSAGAQSHALEGYTHKVTLLNSYHTSRYNVNTGRLTFEMFHEIVMHIAKRIA